MNKFKISSTVKYLSSDSNELNSFTLPIPEAMLIFTKDLKEIRKGTGIGLYKDLVKLIDLDNINDSIKKHNSLPLLSPYDAGKVLSVKTNGTATPDDNIVPSDLMDDNKFNAIVNKYSPIIHQHSQYLKKDIVNAQTRPNIDNLKNQDVLSYLMLNRLEHEKNISIITKNTFFDNFMEGGFIDAIQSTNVVVDNGTVTITDTLISSTSFNNTNINVTKLYFKSENTMVQKNIRAYVSRDGGINYTPMTLTKKASMFFGSSSYDEKFYNITPTFTNVVLEDYKGYNTRFTVDTDNTSGHVDNGLNVTELAGYKINLINGMSVIIDNISGSGVMFNSINFSGILSPGTYIIDNITSIEHDEVNTSVNIISELSVAGSFTIEIDPINHPIYSKYIGSHIVALRNNNQYRIYKNEQWETIVKYENGNWQYRSISGNWVLASVNNPNVALTEACRSSNNRMIISNLEGISLKEFSDSIDGIGVYIPEGTTNSIGYGDIINLSRAEIVDLPNGSEFRYKLVNVNNNPIDVTSVRVVNK